MPAPETSSQEQLQPGETFPKKHASDTRTTGSTGLPVPWLTLQRLFWLRKPGNAPSCSARACRRESTASVGCRRGGAEVLLDALLCIWPGYLQARAETWPQGFYQPGRRWLGRRSVWVRAKSLLDGGTRERLRRPRLIVSLISHGD